MKRDNPFPNTDWVDRVQNPFYHPRTDYGDRGCGEAGNR